MSPIADPRKKEGKKMKKRLVTWSVLVIMVISIVSCAAPAYAARSSGTYPTRKGTILVTSDVYKNLIPTGHAAIVWNSAKVIEAVARGVVWGNNNWRQTKKNIYGLTVKGTTAAQDAKAADWCRKQIGKKYNYNYFNKSTRAKFYCSQLVWAAFKDLYRIDLDTSLFTKFAIHPMELVYTNRTSLIYRYSK
ncbi:MAG: hypothetical protein IJR97_11490 [Clostridia bacterium]|nr:hypothetical protein [Clostridia bacterium]